MINNFSTLKKNIIDELNLYSKDKKNKMNIDIIKEFYKSNWLIMLLSFENATLNLYLFRASPNQLEL